MGGPLAGGGGGGSCGDGGGGGVVLCVWRLYYYRGDNLQRVSPTMPSSSSGHSTGLTVISKNLF